MHNKIIYQFLIAALLIGVMPMQQKAKAISCPDLRIIFVSEVNGGQGTSRDYVKFRETLEPYLQASDSSYEFIDLDYPAVGVNIDNLRKSIESPIDVSNVDILTNSVNAGSENLTKLVNNSCPNSKYIIAGYSEGAMVVSKSLNNLNTDKIIYAATFGDPLIYFPEGNGDEPDACNSISLSNYRAYAPDCQSHQGLFGALSPYQPEKFIDKLGAWCNQRDTFCSAHSNTHLHTTYIEDGIYEDAAGIIANKINQYFNIEPNMQNMNLSYAIEPANLQFKKAILKVTNAIITSNSEAKINFEIEGLSSATIVIINNQIIGLTAEKTIFLNNIQPEKEYRVRLVPIKKSLLGDGVDVKIQIPKSAPEVTIPKAPNTGRSNNR